MQQISIFSPAMSLGPGGPSQDRAATPAQRGRVDVRDLAERVSRVWHAEHMPDGIRVPVGVVASLAQFAETPGTGAALMALAPETLWRLLERVWAVRWIEQPELAAWAAPLHEWLMIQPSPRQARSVVAVTHAALDAGLLRLTGAQDAQVRREADPLGAVLTTLRSKGARQANAEEHTLRSRGVAGAADAGAGPARFGVALRTHGRHGRADPCGSVRGSVGRARCAHLRVGDERRRPAGGGYLGVVVDLCYVRHICSSRPCLTSIRGFCDVSYECHRCPAVPQ